MGKTFSRDDKDKEVNPTKDLRVKTAKKRLEGREEQLKEQFKKATDMK